MSTNQESPTHTNESLKTLKAPNLNITSPPKLEDLETLPDSIANETPLHTNHTKIAEDPIINQTPLKTNDAKIAKDSTINETPSQKNDDPKPSKDTSSDETLSETDDFKILKAPNINLTPPSKPDDAKTLQDRIADDAEIVKDSRTNDTPSQKNDDPKSLEDPISDETSSETEVPETLKAPNVNLTPPSKPDDAKILQDQIADDAEIVKDSRTNKTLSPKNNDLKPSKDPNTNETPPEPNDPKTLEDPVVNVKDLIANKTTPQTNDAKTIKDSRTNETSSPKNGYPQPFKDPNTNKTLPNIEDTEDLRDPNADLTPPSKPDDPITFEDSKTNEMPQKKTNDSETLKDPNTNEPPPLLETRTSFENHPKVEDVETLKQDPNQEPEIDENHNEISPADGKITTSKQLSLTKSKTTSNADPRPKKTSSWRLLDKARMIALSPFKKKQCPKPSDVDKITSTKEAEKEVELPSKLKKAIQDDVDHTERGATMLSEYKEQLNKILKELEAQQGSLGEDLRKLHQDLIKLRLQITLKYKDSFKNFDFTNKPKQAVPKEVLDMMPQLHKDPFFETSPEFKDFEARYEKLELKLKLCLLCFSVFPENAVIKKRVMVQWWVSEGFASEEDVAKDYFIQLIIKGFIQPDGEDRMSFNVGRCRMHPFYRSALVMLAERAKFLNFDRNGQPTQNFTGTFRTCLVGEGLISYEDLNEGSVEVLDLEKVHLLININEAVLEFKKNWFSKMRNVNILYLGKWEASATGHREVDDTVFLEKELKNMSYVKFLSLQGVSNMIDLPESVLKLKNLEILDIRACHNLETIPKKIRSLECLTHLDMSECYLLEHMPKDISLLKCLRVLKGFVVGKETKKNISCTLDDLKGLKNLIKLSIYTGLREFPNSRNIVSLGNLTGLRKLTISWGGNAFKSRNEDGSDESSFQTNGSDVEKDASSKTGGLPLGLEKLDLRYFPTSKTPDWLRVENLKGLNELKRLYIRAGKFSDIGQYQESDNWDRPVVEKDVWKVEVLRLRYLPEIEMEWRQVQELFPELVYLEQVGCPRLTLLPCDANGVWRKPK